MNTTTSNPTIARWLFLGLLGLLVATAISADEGATAYRHPLSQTSLKSGRIPALELKNAESGDRYAVEESIDVSEDGHVDRRSGIVELSRRQLTAADLAETRDAREAKGVRLPDGPIPAVKVGSPLETAIQAAKSDQLLDVMVRLERPSRRPLVAEIERKVARGEIRTRDDYARERARLLAERGAEIARVQQPVMSFIEQMGGEVTYLCESLYCLDARLTPALVQLLADRADVARIDLDTATVAEAEIQGKAVRSGTQLDQFVKKGFDGGVGPQAEVTFAVIEQDNYNDEHVGFRQAKSKTHRIRSRYSCGGSCAKTKNFAQPADDHATAIAGVIFGDLTDGQDSKVKKAVDRQNRSGYAGEARGYLYKYNGTTSGLRKAIDHAGGQSPLPSVVNLSQGSGADDTDCTGQTALSRDANELFENGVLMIKSAGNDGHDVDYDCRVSSPGAAIGVFTVNGHGKSVNGTAKTVRGADIYPKASMGGSFVQNDGRTLIDMTAFAYRGKLFDAAGGYKGVAAGTSVAAATVTAGAIDFIDFYKRTYSDFIDDPGILYTNLLLMGDRQNRDGEKNVDEFDRLWGAGRFQMRKFDTAGMDAPWGWTTGWTCVDDGEEVRIQVNKGNALSASVDVFKAAVYWYDPNHESGESLDDINVWLRKLPFGTLESGLGVDNKKLVYSDQVGGEAIEIEIEGDSISGSDPTCGANSLKVYYAYFYEDSARNDTDGPGNEIAPE